VGNEGWMLMPITPYPLTPSCMATCM
jgi:hypothetical protein